MRKRSKILSVAFWEKVDQLLWVTLRKKKFNPLGHFERKKSGSTLRVIFKKKSSILRVIFKKKVQFFEFIYTKKKVQFFEFIFNEKKRFNYLSHVEKRLKLFESCSKQSSKEGSIDWIMFKRRLKSLSHVKKGSQVFESYKKGSILWVISEKKGSIICSVFEKERVQFFEQKKINALSNKKKSSILWVM